MKYLFLKRELGQKNYNISDTLGDKCLSHSTVRNQVPRFRIWHLSTVDRESSGRTTQMIVPESVDAIHSMILDDQRISAKMITATLAICILRLSSLYYLWDFRYERLSASGFPNVVLIRSVIKCILHKPFWSDFGRILWDFWTIS
jgi:hypothetical protein